MLFGLGASVTLVLLFFFVNTGKFNVIDINKIDFPNQLCLVILLLPCGMEK